MSKVKRVVGCKGFSNDEFIAIAEKRFKGKFTFDKTNYVNKKTAITITCKVHGDFVAKPMHFMRSPFGCPDCGKRVNLEKFISLATETHGDAYDYSNVVYVNATTPVEIVCKIHGSFWQEPYMHYSRENKCPKCAREGYRLTQEGFIRRSREKHGDKYDYSRTFYRTLVEPVTIGCPRHGEFTQVARSHLAGNGCGDCFIEDRRGNTGDFIRQAKEIHGDKYDYSEVAYTTSKHPVTIICPTHGPFKKTPNQHLSTKSGCPVCIESKGEISIRAFMEKHGIRHIGQYVIKPHKYRYDFYLPDFNILIEFHGQQHYHPVERFGGEKAFEGVVERDKEKRWIAKSLNIPLITLTYKHMGESFEWHLIQALKRKYRVWLKINGMVKVYKTIDDLYAKFNLPRDLSSKHLLSAIAKTNPDVAELF